MITFEMMHFLNRKIQGKEGYVAMKIDISKAYNRLEWGFLRDIMLKLGFA